MVRSGSFGAQREVHRASVGTGGQTAGIHQRKHSDTLPPNAELLSEPSVPVAVRAGASVPSAMFSIGTVTKEKAIRKVLDKR